MRLAVLLLALACTPVTTERWGYPNFPGEAPYDVRAASATPAGVRYDPTGQAVSPAVLDRLTAEVEACTGKIDRSSFVVKIPAPPDWAPSCDGSQQVLRSRAPDDGCRAKGLTPDAACPCRWRARIQWPNVIVATPSLYLYKDALTRFVTGSRDPWSDPKLAPCVAPTTPPL